MFSHLVNLGKFTVINSVTEIQAGAFEGCDKLYVINNMSDLEIVKGDAVGNGGIAKNAVVVYCGSDQIGSQYYVYGDIIVLDTGFLDGHKRVVFEYIGNETELYITDGVNYFGWTHMTPNYTVNAIYLGDCVEYARGQAFEQFKALKTVYVMGNIDDMDISSANDFLSYGIELVVLGN